MLYGLSLALREILAHYKSRNDDPDDKQGNVTVNIVIDGRTVDLSEEGSGLREQIEEAVKKGQSPNQ